MPGSQVTLRHSEAYQDIVLVHDALYAYNLRKTGEPRRSDVHASAAPGQTAIMAENEPGVPLGGVVYTWKEPGHYVYVSLLHLDEQVRGRGIGKMLLEAVEMDARDGGATKVVLSTNDFQAPGFYQKCGYTIIASPEAPHPFCPHNRHHILEKAL